MDSSSYSFEPSFLELPCDRRYVRSSSQSSSVYSAVSTVESTPDSVSTRCSTPPRASPPVRHHGPVLLPKIRPQDQHLDECQPPRAAAVSTKKSSRARNVTPARASSAQPIQPIPSGHMTSFTRPVTLTNMAYAHLSSLSGANPLGQHQHSLSNPAPLLSSPVIFSSFNCGHGRNTGIMATEPSVMAATRQASTRFGLDGNALAGFACSTYKQPALNTPPSDFSVSSLDARDQSPISLAGTPEPAAMSTPSTTLINYLMMPNPAPSLVRTISLPLRDASIKHFWWDVRNIRPWSSFDAQSIFALPGASALLTTPVSTSLLPQLSMPGRNPETEASLHSIYASYYLPKLNAALSISFGQPLQFSVPAKSPHSIKDHLFVARAPGDAFSATTIFGGKPLARVVGLVRSFDRFNTGMRVEGNIKRVEYLRGLAALHHAMREHSCRYGFILTEIELVLVRCGTESVPHFGDLQVTSVQLSHTAESDDAAPLATRHNQPPAISSLTACLALWGLCQLAADDAPAGHAHWKTQIGAPAEGSRRKAKPRDGWLPQPQLAEKREAKRSRGWIWPEDAIGRKELGKRGVKYGGL
ncbi:hypothetical protein E4U42_005094 [Claviceps africana]|uniref:Sialidase n=1 Tax=Claviceps africana TaxID=83212 RepID=A0A8K0JE18_9HYPO|nr:hypothetical protein E4U42_005094 [Claviceps africana]